MIVIKHRWMKNRNVTMGSTIISFNHEGIARIPHVGNAIVNVDIYVKNSKGLAEFVEDPRQPGSAKNPFPVEAEPEPPKPEPDEATKRMMGIGPDLADEAAPLKSEPEPEPVKAPEPEPEVEEKASLPITRESMRSPKKKVPPKKPPAKKTTKKKTKK
jgi:hypothetical protein